MDFPDYTFDELATLAKSRDAWRAGGSRLKSVPTHQHGISRAHLRRGLKPSTRSISTALPQTTTSSTIRAKRYVARDKHEAFLRPPDSNARELKRQRQAQQCNKKKQKRPNWTNKQRVAWAREHYQQHHGQHATTAKPAQAPTWEFAAAAVFSSSSDDDGSYSNDISAEGMKLSTALTPTGSPYQPPSWVPAATAAANGSPHTPPRTPATATPHILPSPTRRDDMTATVPSSSSLPMMACQISIDIANTSFNINTTTRMTTSAPSPTPDPAPTSTSSTTTENTLYTGLI